MLLRIQCISDGIRLFCSIHAAESNIFQVRLRGIEIARTQLVLRCMNALHRMRVMLGSARPVYLLCTTIVSQHFVVRIKQTQCSAIDRHHLGLSHVHRSQIQWKRCVVAQYCPLQLLQHAWNSQSANYIWKMWIRILISFTIIELRQNAALTFRVSLPWHIRPAQ